MKKKIGLLAAMVCFIAIDSSDAATLSITDNPILVSGAIGTDYNLYKQVGATLVNDNTVSPASVLSGTKSEAMPGGNIHLAANQDSITLAAFQTESHIALTGLLGGHAISISNLTGTDWFTTPTLTYTTAYGAPTLANQWFSNFLSAYSFTHLLSEAGYNSSTIATQEAGLYTSFTNAQALFGIPGGFQHLSTTSVSYVQEDTTTDLMSIGIADTDGYLYPLIKSYVQQNAPNVLNDPDFPTDVYASKVADVSIDGQTPIYLYSYNSVPSGLSTNDGTDSYTLEYQVSTPVPEPASLGWMIVIGIVSLARRVRHA